MGKNSKKDNACNEIGDFFSLTPIKSRKLEVSFTAPDLSSQDGLLLLREDEQHNGFISRLSGCIEDARYQLFVQHSYYEMLQQRVCQIAAGYADADDCDLLRNDSIPVSFLHARRRLCYTAENQTASFQRQCVGKRLYADSQRKNNAYRCSYSGIENEDKN